MNPARVAIPILLRASRCARPMAPRPLRTPKKVIYGSAPSLIQTQSRFYSQDSATNKTYTFEEIKKVSEQPSPDRIIIDVREPSELSATGRIPSSISIPLASKPDSFFISEEEFEDRFGFSRPEKDKEVIFYCKAGVRSQAAARLARQAGWEKIGEYPGSWLDWAEKGGRSEK